MSLEGVEKPGRTAQDERDEDEQKGHEQRREDALQQAGCDVGSFADPRQPSGVAQPFVQSALKKSQTYGV